MKKRLLALTLTLIMVLGLAIPASAASFTDVAPGAWYEEAVNWAVENGITTGMGNGLFAPNNTCTRGQVVTFLWRSQGEPAPAGSNNPFSDVKEGDYFYEAVLWAVENGITTGLSATEFGPNSPCNRAQVVTFLWRTMGKPAPEDPTNPFGDVAEGVYYFDAVLWAVEKGITTGMGDGIFAPNNACNRGQIVCFLYRTPSEDGEPAPDPEPEPDPEPSPDPDPEPSPEPDPEPSPEPQPPVEYVTAPAGLLYMGGKTGGQLSLMVDLRYEYDDAGRVTRVYTTGGEVNMKCSYDKRGNLTELYYKVPGEEKEMGWRYDANDEPIAFYEGGVLVEGYYYALDAEGRLVEEEYLNENNAVVNYLYSYNSNGLLERMLYKAQWQSPITYTYTYDELGRIKQEKADYSDYKITKYKDYEYTSDGGYVITEREPIADGGEPVPVRETRVYEDAEGRIVEECFDVQKQHIQSKSVSTYDAQGNIVEARESRAISTYIWDVGDIYVEDGYVDEFKWEYDAAGNVLLYQEKNYSTTIDGVTGETDYGYRGEKEERYTYNSDGQILTYARKTYEMLTNDGETYYKEQNGAGERSYVYDAQGRLIKSTENRYSFGYYGGEGPELKLYTVVENVWIYDGQGRLVKDYIREVDGEGKGLSYIENYVSYDEQGRITAMKDSGNGNNIQTWSYKYDAAGNVVYEAYSWNESGTIQNYEITSTYDSKGRLSKMVYSDSMGNSLSENYSYDSQSRLYSYTTVENGSRSTTSITFNDENLPLKSTTKYSTEGVTVTCDYSYVKVPKTAENEYLSALIDQIMTLL